MGQSPTAAQEIFPQIMEVERNEAYCFNLLPMNELMLYELGIWFFRSKKNEGIENYPLNPKPSEKKDTTNFHFQELQ